MREGGSDTAAGLINDPSVLYYKEDWGCMITGVVCDRECDILIFIVYDSRLKT